MKIMKTSLKFKIDTSRSSSELKCKTSKSLIEPNSTSGANRQRLAATTKRAGRREEGLPLLAAISNSLPCKLAPLNKYRELIRRFRHNQSSISGIKQLARTMSLFEGRAGALPLLLIIALGLLPFASQSLAASQPSSSSGSSVSSAAASSDYHQHQFGAHHQQRHHGQQIQTRAGGLDPGDYVDEAGELEVMANQQQIPTAQLMAAAGHIVPDNFFLPGGSIPALYGPQLHAARYMAAHHAAAAAAAAGNHQQVDPMQQVASQVQARHVAPGSGSPGSVKYMRQADLLAAAAAAAEQQDNSPLIDFNGYNLATQPEAAAAATNGQSSGGSVAQNPMDLVEFLSPVSQSALFEQQQQHLAEQQIAAELASIVQANREQQHQHQQNLDNSAQSSENSVVDTGDHYSSAASAIGPAYQISSGGHSMAHEMAQGSSNYGQGSGNNYEKEQNQKPYGLPTKSSNKEPSGMLKPLGNPKTVSSPAIDFVANQLPKGTNVEKLAEKLPQMQTPTVFSFASSKDPMEKVKSVNQKKRNVMRQAEQLAKMMIKSVNDKFGTTIGDQTDIPFLLSSLGPLGMAQNLLFDPTLLVTLLNSAEKTYFSDVLPGPAKMAIRPVLNIFRVPNKKRDKANLLNIISFLASGGQTPNSSPKHRQGTGVEKQANKNKSR